MRYAVCKGIYTRELQLKNLMKLILVIFYEYFSEFILVSLVRFCDAVGDTVVQFIYMQV